MTRRKCKVEEIAQSLPQNPEDKHNLPGSELFCYTNTMSFS